MFRRLRAFFVPLLFLTTASLTASLTADEAQREKRSQQFSDRMQNCTLVGSFTVDGQNSEPPKPERYEIESAVPAADDLWVFTVRIKYGKLDTKLPVTVPVKWAGDTPMVTLTNASIPGLGDGFSARVLFYEDRYAGTWQHGAVGGHMFGKIEQPKAAPAKAQPADEKKTAK
ncbi:MAG: hypothetical protein ACKOEO_21020 [Planctomycetaceae bacterium]